MTDRKDERPWRQIVTLRTIVVSVVALVAGIALLYLGGRDDLWTKHQGIQALLNGVAGLLIVSFGLGTLWQLVGKRSFTREILETATASADIDSAGVTRVGMNYREIPDWAALFADVQKLDIFLAYGRTWRNLNYERLRAVAERPGSRIRVYLPDRRDAKTVERLAERFSMTSEALSEAILEAETAYRSLSVGTGSSVEVFQREGESLFSAYRFDSTAVVTMYSHQRKRLDVPTFVCRSGGFLYDFLRSELDAIQAQSTPCAEDGTESPGSTTDHGGDQ